MPQFLNKLKIILIAVLLGLLLNSCSYVENSNGKKEYEYYLAHKEAGMQKQAHVWLGLSYKAGYDDAVAEMATVFFNKEKTYSKNIEENFENLKQIYSKLKKLAKNGNIRAKQALMDLYKTGYKMDTGSENDEKIVVIIEDNEKYINLLKELAEQEKPSAEVLFSLGYEYNSGENIQQDLIKSFQLFKRAADLGLPGAKFNLSIMYRNAYGVKENKDLARKYMFEAFEAGYEKAIEAWQKDKYYWE